MPARGWDGGIVYFMFVKLKLYILKGSIYCTLYSKKRAFEKTELWVLLQNSLSGWNQEPFQRMPEILKHWWLLKQIYLGVKI